jgi:hypothetical protein
MISYFNISNPIYYEYFFLIIILAKNRLDSNQRNIYFFFIVFEDPVILDHCAAVVAVADAAADASSCAVVINGAVVEAEEEMARVDRLALTAAWDQQNAADCGGIGVAKQSNEAEVVAEASARVYHPVPVAFVVVINGAGEAEGVNDFHDELQPRADVEADVQLQGDAVVAVDSNRIGALIRSR